ncbi:MAG: methyltransferase, partial [Actinobacteria bacterium]|nr:methyltransferase [Actinomycetota bacterium]
RSHPDVREAVVAVHEPAPGDRRLVAYVAPGEAVERHAEAVVAGWRALFDDTYATAQAARADLDTAGWNDTATREPIPSAEMAEVVEGAVAGVRALSPRRVLEIGCGAGLLLRRLAPEAERYVATDISGAAVERLTRVVTGRPGADVVELAQQEALEIASWGTAAFDTVVLDSVVQYFPDVRHLLRVLERAVAATADGGSVFVGGVRRLALLDAFWASVARTQAGPGAADNHIRRAAAQAQAQAHDNELVLDAAVFTALPRRLPRVSRVEVRPRRGRGRTELVTYRYDVVLRVGDPAATVEPAWCDWSPGLDVERLLREGAGVLGLRRVPNARVADDVAFARSAPGAPAGADPDDLFELGERLGYRVDVSWASDWPDGSFDVAFVPDRLPPAPVAFPQAEPADDLTRHACEPARRRLARLLAPGLRSWLAARLPAYMAPSAFVVLDDLPRLPSGKMDRRNLPPPGRERPELSAPYTPPRDAVEE